LIAAVAIACHPGRLAPLPGGQRRPGAAPGAQTASSGALAEAPA